MAEAKRRLAAILAADVAGYSRLMGDDERATMDTLNAYRDVFRKHISDYDGRVVDTAGDSVLAIFSSVVEAVQCAVDVQGELGEHNAGLAENRRMLFRVGVNIGDIFEQDDGTIYGDGVNVAARLESLANAGEICVSESAYMQVEGKTDFGFQDIGNHEVKNIARPVRAYRVLSDGAPQANTRPRRVRRGALVAVVAAIVMIAAGVGVWREIKPPGTAPQDPVLALPTGPSIAVLPFDNLSGDPEQEYFVDGLVDNIINGLSLFTDFFVIARGSTFQYKGRAVDVREVGRDLGTRYVLEGSVQKSGDDIRVMTRLLDAKAGKQLWAQTYDRQLSAGNMFAIQDDIRDQVAAMIAGETGIIARHQTAAVQARRTDSLVAYECVLIAVAHYDVFTPASHLRARDCLERALEADPDYAEAWAWLTYLYADEDAFEFNPRPNALDRSLETGLRAVKLDPASAIAHSALARTYGYRRQYEDFFVHAERAVELNPNNVFVIVDMGQFMTMLGKPERGSALVRKAMKLNPYHQGWYYIGFFYENYDKGDYEEALAMAQKMNLPGLWYMHAFLAAANGQLGRRDQARASAETLLALYPEFPAKAREQFSKRLSSHELVTRLIAGLRKAGLDIPEETPADD